LETVIKPTKRLALNWKELVAYRELFFYFAWRDVKVRYKQTVIGASWAIFQPVITMVVFTLFFNKAVGIDADGVPYAIFSFSGLLFWSYFSNALSRSSNSMVDNQAVITKVYFPRLIPPISSTIVALIDFGFASIVFAALMIYFQITPSLLGLALLIPMIAITFIAATGIGFFLAALNVKYRDIKQALPFFIQIGLFITPVIYPISQIPENLKWLFYLNPMTGVIGTVRAGLIGQGTIDWGLIGLSAAISVVLFGLGLAYFRAKEREFADII
jgi:lipopolysaccharide transport system permease protein